MQKQLEAVIETLKKILSQSALIRKYEAWN